MLLALLLGLLVVLLGSRMLGQANEVSFYRQVRDGGQQAVDEVVRVESRLLEAQRAISNTEGVPEAVIRKNAEQLRSRVLQLVVNSDLDVAVVLDRDGSSLLAIRKSSPDAPPGDYLTLRGEGFYQGWTFVQDVLTLTGSDLVGEGGGEKEVGLHTLQIGDEEEYVFFIGAPLTDEDGTIFGAVLVGEYLTTLLDDLSEVARSHASLYDSETGLLLSTVFQPGVPLDPPGLSLTPSLVETAREPADGEQPFRTIRVAGQAYGEVLTPMQVRQGEHELGVLGISLLGEAEASKLSPEVRDRLSTVIRFGAVALVLILITGLLVAQQITKPILDLTEASSEVASGNLQTKVREGGSDELGAMARSFNVMVAGIREDTMYRQLTSQLQDPESRSDLLKTLALRDDLTEGQRVRATILYAEISGHPSDVRRTDPTLVMRTLNEVLDTVIPIVIQHGGVFQEISGDVLLGYFGVLPRSAPLQVSALQATHAGMEMLDFFRRLNERRTAQGLHALDIGIGISSGWVMAGGIGLEDRLQYTLLGNTVTTAKRIQEVTRPVGGGTLIISEDTYEYLSGARSQFEFGRHGRAALPDDRREVGVHEVVGRSTKLVDFSSYEIDDGIEMTESENDFEFDLPTDE
jgi:adenylate cyclase